MPRLSKTADATPAHPVDAVMDKVADAVASVVAPEPVPEPKKRLVKKKAEKEAPAPAPVAVPAPAPAPVEEKKKRVPHANTKTFTKLTDEIKKQVASHPDIADREFARRLRTHLMLGKSLEEAEKLAKAGKKQ